MPLVSRLIFLPLAIAMVIVGGCVSKATLANISLRKQQQGSQTDIEMLKREHAADEATIAALQKNNGSLQTLTEPKLDELFTAHGLSLKRLTGGFDSDPKTAGDEALKIYAVPTDDQGQPIKAVGAFEIQAFAIGKDDVPLQTWNFSPEQARAAWLGDGLLYEFVLLCPFNSVPKDSKLRTKVVFTDALTGRVFSAEKQITIHPG